MRAREAALAETLRVLVEFVVLLGLLLVGLLITVLQGAGDRVVPLLGMYAYAGFRLIPSANRLLMYVNLMRFGRGRCHPLESWEGYAHDAFQEGPRAGLVEAALGGQNEHARGHGTRPDHPQFPRLKRRFQRAGPRGLLHAGRAGPLPEPSRSSSATAWRLRLRAMPRP